MGRPSRVKRWYKGRKCFRSMLLFVPVRSIVVYPVAVNRPERVLVKPSLTECPLRAIKVKHLKRLTNQKSIVGHRCCVASHVDVTSHPTRGPGLWVRSPGLRFVVFSADAKHVRLHQSDW